MASVELMATKQVARLGKGLESAPPQVEMKSPAVPIRKSVTPDYLICLEDGKKFKSLRRHLAGLGLTPEQYRKKWKLPSDYPMVAPNYAARHPSSPRGRRRQLPDGAAATVMISPSATSGLGWKHGMRQWARRDRSGSRHQRRLKRVGWRSITLIRNPLSSARRSVIACSPSGPTSPASVNFALSACHHYRVWSYPWPQPMLTRYSNVELAGCAEREAHKRRRVSRRLVRSYR